MIERLSTVQVTPEELGLTQLSQYAASREGKDRIEAQLLWQRRLILSITPLIFCLLGSAMILRTNRGGRGFGTVLALLGLLVYYLVAFFGEQLARTGAISVPFAALLPIIVSVLLIVLLGITRRIRSASKDLGLDVKPCRAGSPSSIATSASKCFGRSNDRTS